MCGIAGIISSFAGGQVDGETVRHMRDTLSHRGPDDSGLWMSRDSLVGLGHRRLSVLDISELGHQPMVASSGKAVICYNGEVYNFGELRSELAQTNRYAFRSDTDTEVILQAYLAWGDTFVDRLEGMFAICIWDIEKNRAILVRDRLGIKPLVYALSNDRLIFASEIRGVLASGEISRELSTQAAWDFFSYGYVPTPQTIYSNIKKLPPATIMTYENGKIEMRTYWEPEFDCSDIQIDRAISEISELTDRSVDGYLVSDVPTGCYLSGGLDSSIVTQRAAYDFSRAKNLRLGGTELNTFTIAFDVDEDSDAHYAKIAAQAYDTNHREMTVSREMAHAKNDAILDMFDEPFAASSTIPMTYLAEFARRHVTVALCGEGGDETFGGYSWYSWWQKFRQPGFWNTASGKILAKTYELVTGKQKKKWSYPELEDVELFARLMGAVSEKEKTKIFSGDLSGERKNSDGAAYFRQFWRTDLPPISRMQYLDIKTFLCDLNLARADRTSMAVGLELRVPLLNHHLVEYVIALKSAVRNPDSRLKGLFKQTFEKRLPQEVVNRKKRGFSAPVKEWFTNSDLVKLVDDIRHEHPEIAGTWLNSRVSRYAGHVSGSRAYKLWVFLRWIRKFG